MHRWTALAFALVFGGAVALLVAQPRTSTRGRAVPLTPQSAAPSVSAAASAIPAPVPGPAPNPPPAQSAWTLPDDAPGVVGFGVIQFTYQGAQFAPPDAVPKAEALAKAEAILPDAQRDFSSAAKKADSASGADLGDIPRGVLEPELEFVLFTMKVGTIHPKPLDTPRGFWIVRRNR